MTATSSHEGDEVQRKVRKLAMPLYEYQCDTCGHRFEVIVKFSDPPLDKCPKCGGPVHKLISSPAFQFKGTGWYVTDYAKKDHVPGGKTSESSGEGESKDKSDGGGKNDGGKNEKSSGEHSEKSEKADKGSSTAESSSSGSSGSSSTASSSAKAEAKPSADTSKKSSGA
jgi:putative FmdB family regulatory protein